MVHHFTSRITGAVLLLAIFICCSAQNQVKIFGQFIDIPTGDINAISLKASFIEGDEQTFAVSEFNSFAGTVETKESGICALTFKDYTYNFVLGPEPVLRFSIEKEANDQVKIYIQDSKENDAYQFTKILMNDQNKMYSYFANCSFDSCAYMMRIEEDSYRHNRDSILKLYPGTYCADVLCRFYDLHAPAIGKLLPSVVKNEFLQHTPWQLSNAYNNKTMSHAARLYLDYAPDTGAALRQSIKILLDKAEPGSVSRNRLANILFDIFADYADENRLIQFLNLSFDVPDLFSDPVLKEKCNRIAKTVPGKKAPPITLPDSTGQEISLLDIAAAHPYTLLVIWNPDCPHCIAAMPILKELYNKYHPKGLEIFAVSLGGTQSEWVEAINKSKCNWVNVHVNEKNKSQPEDYFITYTPALVLLNRQGIIVKRRLAVEELEITLGEYFIK